MSHLECAAPLITLYEKIQQERLKVRTNPDYNPYIPNDEIFLSPNEEEEFLQQFSNPEQATAALSELHHHFTSLETELIEYLQSSEAPEFDAALEFYVISASILFAKYYLYLQHIACACSVKNAPLAQTLNQVRSFIRSQFEFYYGLHPVMTWKQS